MVAGRPFEQARCRIGLGAHDRGMRGESDARTRHRPGPAGKRQDRLGLGCPRAADEQQPHRVTVEPLRCGHGEDALQRAQVVAVPESAAVGRPVAQVPLTATQLPSPFWTGSPSWTLPAAEHLQRECCPFQPTPGARVPGQLGVRVGKLIEHAACSVSTSPPRPLLWARNPQERKSADDPNDHEIGRATRRDSVDDGLPHPGPEYAHDRGDPGKTSPPKPVTKTGPTRSTWPRSCNARLRIVRRRVHPSGVDDLGTRGSSGTGQGVGRL
jgi:hypothetical protein